MSKKRNNKHWLKEAKHYNAPRPEPKPKTPRTRDPWKLTRKVLAALLKGAELVLLPGRGWRLVGMTGRVMRVKAKLVAGLLRDACLEWHDATDWTAFRLGLTVIGAALLSQIPRGA